MSKISVLTILPKKLKVKKIKIKEGKNIEKKHKKCKKILAKITINDKKKTNDKNKITKK